MVSDTMEETEVEDVTVNKLPDKQITMDESSDSGESDYEIADVMAGDDAHLLQAHTLVSARNRTRGEDDEKVFTSGPPTIEVIALPLSKSQDFQGFIPNDKFQSLVKILLASQLYLDVYGPEHLCAKDNALAEVTSIVFNTFSQFTDQPDIPWNLFSSALTTTIVGCR